MEENQDASAIPNVTLVPPINLVSRVLALTNSNTVIAKSIVQSRCCLLQAKLPMSVRCPTDPTHRSSQLRHLVGGASETGRTAQTGGYIATNATTSRSKRRYDAKGRVGTCNLDTVLGRVWPWLTLESATQLSVTSGVAHSCCSPLRPSDCEAAMGGKLAD